MQSSIAMAFGIMFPLAFQLAAGVFCRRQKLIGPEGIQQANQLIFHLFLPLMIFSSIYHTDQTTLFSRRNLLLAALTAGITLAIVLFSEGAQRLRGVPAARRGVVTQGLYQTNGVIFSLPIITALCGAENLGPLSLLIMLLTPLDMALAVLVLSPIRGGAGDFRGLARQILTNPPLLAAAAAFAAGGLGLRLPPVLDSTFTTLSAVTTPLAFVLLGGSLSTAGFRRHAGILVRISAVRLLLCPAAGLALCLALGLRGAHAATMLGLMGAPTAVSSFTLAQAYGGEADLAAEIVAATTLGSALTMFCWVAGLNACGIL